MVGFPPPLGPPAKCEDRLRALCRGAIKTAEQARRQRNVAGSQALQPPFCSSVGPARTVYSLFKDEEHAPVLSKYYEAGCSSKYEEVA